jgi:uncharacterized RDD family membrane protein YckC
MNSSAHAVGYPVSSTQADIHVTGRRILATLIDSIILGAAYNVLTLMFGEFQHPRPWEWNGALDNVAVNILYGVGVVAYFVLMEGYVGQTLGKMVAGITVVSADTLSTPGIGSAVIRTVLRIVDGLLGYAVAFVTVLISFDRQRLGDMAAHTLVVRK